MMLNIICDRETRRKLCAVYGKRGKGNLVIIHGVDDTLYLDFISEGEGITGDLPEILDKVAREYWKRHEQDRYIKGTYILKDDYPCFGNYNGYQTCNDCLLWRECANDG